MRSYFVTVRAFEDAIDIDPLAKYVRTLPATVHVSGYCCRESESHPVPEAYIYQVQVKSRRDAETAKGVIKCRAKEPEKYRTSMFTWVC